MSNFVPNAKNVTPITDRLYRRGVVTISLAGTPFNNNHRPPITGRIPITRNTHKVDNSGRENFLQPVKRKESVNG